MFDWLFVCVLCVFVFSLVAMYVCWWWRSCFPLCSRAEAWQRDNMCVVCYHSTRCFALLGHNATPIATDMHPNCITSWAAVQPGIVTNRLVFSA